MNVLINTGAKLKAGIALSIALVVLLDGGTPSFQAGSHWSMALAAQLPVEKLPKPSDYVSDFAHVLSPDAVLQVDRICSQLDHSNADTQVAVVTIRTLNGADIADYARNLANRWGVGRKSSNRGVTFLLATDDHKWRIAVGRGLEGILTNSKADAIGREMIPRLRANDYNGAVTLAVGEIARVITISAEGKLDPMMEPHAH
ncbi:MAG: TPM domain-containing protein [Terracidiphilus sp.]